MDEHDYLSREDFERLTDEEQLAYYQDVRVELDEETVGARLARMSHIYDIAEWMMPGEEIVRLISLPLWNMAWENVEMIEATLVEAIASGKLSGDELTSAQKILERARQVLQEKRDLENL